MSLPITVPYTFGNVTSSIPLSNLDSDFATVYAAVNGIGNGTVALANVVITGGVISNVALTLDSLNSTPIGNVTPSTGAFTTVTLSGYLGLSSWTTSTRPSSPSTGTMGYNTTFGGIEVYNGSAWDLITGGPAIQVYNNVAQSISTTTGTIIQANTKVFDTNGCYNNTSSSTTLNGITVPAWSFAPNVPGYYQVNAQTIVQNTLTGVNETYLYKNGGVYAFGASGPSDGGNMLSTISMVVYCNGTGDYIQFGTFQTAGSTKTLLTGNTGFNNMSIAYVRGA